jgi:hypothetical protein
VRDRIAPRAAEIDETGEFPWDVYDALKSAGFHAIHIPEEYGGQGGDALAACLVIEEVARACASSSLIPAVNKLGTLPLMIAGDEALLQRYLPKVASGEAMFSYALSEREAGSDAASMTTKAVRLFSSMNGEQTLVPDTRKPAVLCELLVVDGKNNGAFDPDPAAHNVGGWRPCCPRPALRGMPLSPLSGGCTPQDGNANCALSRTPPLGQRCVMVFLRV